MFLVHPGWLSAVLVATASSVVGLLSVWAGLGRGHWFVRLAAVGAVLALGIFVPAYDLILLFFTQAAVVTLALLLVRAVRGRGARDASDPASRIAGRGMRFALADLFLGVAVAGGVFAVAANSPKEVWAQLPSIATLGASLGAVTLAAVWTARGRGHIFIHLAVTGLVAPSVSRHSLLIVRAGQVVLGAMIVLPPAYTWYRLITPPPIPDTSLPNPNAYEELVALASPIALATVPDHDAPVNVLRPFVAQYRPVLDRARLALAGESAVPINYLSPELPLERINALRSLCRALVAEGRLAGHEGDITRAVQSHTNCVQLGHSAARGGLVIDWLVATAIEGIGISELSKVRDRLSAPDCRELAQNLVAVEVAREPLDRVLMRDTAWLQHAIGWPERLEVLFDDLTSSSGGGHRAYRTLDQRNRAFIRLLICDLNIRAFQLEQGKLPGNLSQLVPEYLPSVPNDPFFSGWPLVYRVQADGYILYSVGPNRKDDGGRADLNDGDLRLGM